MPKRVKTRDFVPRYEALIWASFAKLSGFVGDFEFLERAESLNCEVIEALSPAALERVKAAAWARYERKRAQGRTEQ